MMMVMMMMVMVMVIMIINRRRLLDVFGFGMMGHAETFVLHAHVLLGLFWSRWGVICSSKFAQCPFVDC